MAGEAQAGAGAAPAPPVTGKAPKTPKEKKEPTVRRSKFADLYPDNSVITVLAEKNPKKEGSKAHERFKLYGKETTVRKFLDAGGTYQDIAYNVGREFVRIKKVPDAPKPAASGGATASA